MINLIIKGNMFDAFNAAHERGIALLSAAQTFNDRPSEVVASCADTHLDAVRTWYLASDAADIVPGFGYPAGALLFYSTKPDARREQGFNDWDNPQPARDDDERDAEPRKACINTLKAHLAQGNRATRRARRHRLDFVNNRGE
jgi:hypothetical protein